MNEQVDINKIIDKKIGDAIDKYIDDDSVDDYGSYASGFQRGIQWTVDNRCFFMGYKVEIDERYELSLKRTEEPCQFKDGDFVVFEGTRPIVFIYKERRDADTLFYHCFQSSDGYIFYDSWVYAFNGIMRMAGPFEKKRLINALAREGKRWNPDSLKFEDIELHKPLPEEYE